MSFFYFAPSTSIAAVPTGSNSLPFIFSETTKDYQTVTIQGQVTYKITNPKQLADLLDFTVDQKGIYKKNDLEKLNRRIASHWLGNLDARQQTYLGYASTCLGLLQHSATELAEQGLIDAPPETLAVADHAFAGPHPWMADTF